VGSRIDINADMGESFGPWKLGDDRGMLPYVSSANIACGGHAGDPSSMRSTTEAAVQLGVQIGAHVGLPDLLGFGRRRLAISPAELRDLTLHQLAGLDGFARAAGGRVAHVKPHGALYAMCAEDAELAAAVVEAMVEFDSSLILVLTGEMAAAAAHARGIRFAPEGFPDNQYFSDGTFFIERVKVAVEPEWAADRVVRLVREHVIEARDGTIVPLAVETACLHGDAPNAVEVARAVHDRLSTEGIEMRALASSRAPA
jgi:UPF0271 protein